MRTENGSNVFCVHLFGWIRILWIRTPPLTHSIKDVLKQNSFHVPFEIQFCTLATLLTETSNPKKQYRIVSMLLQ